MEKELVKKLKLLKNIKPNKDWVFSLKYEILKEKPSIIDFLSLKPVLAISVVSLLFLLGFQIFILPSISPKPSQPLIVSQKKDVFEPLEEKLQEIKKVAKSKDEKKLMEKIQEYKNSAKFAAKEIEKEKIDSKKIEKFAISQMEVRKTLFSLDEDYLKEFQNEASCVLAEKLIRDFEGKSLTEKQKLYFEAGKEFFEQGNCVDSLTNLWYLNNIE